MKNRCRLAQNFQRCKIHLAVYKLTNRCRCIQNFQRCVLSFQCICYSRILSFSFFLQPPITPPSISFYFSLCFHLYIFILKKHKIEKIKQKKKYFNNNPNRQSSIFVLFVCSRTKKKFIFSICVKMSSLFFVKIVKISMKIV